MDPGDRQHTRHHLVHDCGLHRPQRFDQSGHSVPGQQLVAVATDGRLDGPGDAVGLAMHGRASTAGCLRLRMAHPRPATTGQGIDGRRVLGVDATESRVLVKHLADGRHSQKPPHGDLRLGDDVARNDDAVAAVGQ